MSNIVAIDGPAASGKSTVARRVAAALGWLYVDSGALYRGVTWTALRRGVSPRDWRAVIELLKGLPVRFHVAGGAIGYTMDGLEPGEAIRGREVNENVSFIAAMPAVRARVVEWLRHLAAYGPLVMEGRDIGTVVFPQAAHKFYLDAAPEERARRRYEETRSAVAGGSVGEVGASLQRRDSIDRSRKAAPLKVAAGARIVDSTGLGIDEVSARILREVRDARPRFVFPPEP